MTSVWEVFDTNTLGLMAMRQAVLPQFRERRAGVIVNVTSSSVLTPMPLVQPGYGPTTRFAANGSKRRRGLVPEAYAGYAQRVFAMLTQMTTVTAEANVAEAVWLAATDADGPLRRPAGADAVALARRGTS